MTGTRRPAAAAAAAAAVSASRFPNVRRRSPSIAATGTPFRYTTRLPAELRMRSSPVMMPVRLSGSTPPIVIRRSSRLERRTSRSRSTASGSAKCSRDIPVTNRPPRISPRASKSAVDARQLAPRQATVHCEAAGLQLVTVRNAEVERVGARQLHRPVARSIVPCQFSGPSENRAALFLSIPGCPAD
jgi:hypothetical protein